MSQAGRRARVPVWSPGSVGGLAIVVNAFFYFAVSQDLGHHFLVLSFLATV